MLVTCPMRSVVFVCAIAGALTVIVTRPTIAAAVVLILIAHPLSRSRLCGLTSGGIQQNQGRLSRTLWSRIHSAAAATQVTSGPFVVTVGFRWMQRASWAI